MISASVTEDSAGMERQDGRRNRLKWQNKFNEDSLMVCCFLPSTFYSLSALQIQPNPSPSGRNKENEFEKSFIIFILLTGKYVIYN